MKEKSRAASYEGIPVEWIVGICWAGRQRRVSTGALATWAALVEILAQRRVIERQNRQSRARTQPSMPRLPRWSVQGVARMRRVDEATARAEIHELEHAGIVSWSEEAVEFLPLCCSVLAPERPQVQQIVAELKAPRGELGVPVLRYALRLLAQKQALIVFQSMMAICVRVCWRRGKELSCSGSVLAAWVRDVFGIGNSSWRAATRYLEGLGVIRKERIRSTARRCKEGQFIQLAGAWILSKLESSGKKRRAALESSGKQNQELSPPERDLRGPETLRGAAGSSTNRPPDLRNVVRDDLIDRERSFALREQAVERGLCPDTESGTLNFLASIEHALAHGRDPVRLFMSNLLTRRAFITGADEERALHRLRQHRAMAEASSPTESRTEKTTLLSEILGGMLAALA